MARSYIREQSTIAVLTSEGITTTAVNTTAPTKISTVSAGNADGAEWLDLYVDVAGSTADTVAGVKIYASSSEDDTDYTEYTYALTIPTKDVAGDEADGYYGPYSYYAPGPYLNLKMMAIDAAGTATLTAVPRHHADA